MRIILTGGGTGGHVIPFAPLVNTLRTVYQEKKDTLPRGIDREKLDLYFLGVVDQATSQFYQSLGLKVINIPAAKLRRYPSARTVSDLLLRLPFGCIKALAYVWRIMPDVIICKGGYGSLPVSLAAFFLHIPLLLHESDAVMGLTNKTIANWAQVITVGFDATRHNMNYHQQKTIVTGTPVRPNLARANKQQSQRMFNFSANDKIILIMGGSQGAQAINNLTLELLPNLIDKFGIIHLTGKSHLEAVQKQAQQIIGSHPRARYYRPFSYLDNKIGPALTIANLVISRAGATTLAELAHLRKVAIIVPLPQAARDHQNANAQIFELAGAAIIISQDNLRKNILLQNINELMANQKLRDDLQANITKLDHPNAARDIAKLALKLASGLVPFQTTNAPKNKKSHHSRQR